MKYAFTLAALAAFASAQEYKAPEYKAPEYKAPHPPAPTPEYKAPEYKAPDYKPAEPKKPDYPTSYPDYWSPSYPAGEFTSFYKVVATPDQVVNSMSLPAPGQPGAKGLFKYAINSKTDTICYDITLEGVTGDYQSPAKTATHIHEGAKGRSGPPRIALPNPGPITDYGVRRSTGCLTGPFTTGIKGPDNTTDTGAGFKLYQIEANPSGFFTDSHTVLYVPGVVRGQLDQDYKIVEKKYDDYGSHITTATYTKTEEITLTKCPPEKTECPYAHKPVVTYTEKVYTTVCPVSDLPKYYTKYTKPVYTKPHETVYTKPVETVYTKPHEPVYTKPVEPVYTKPVEPVYTKPAYPTTYVPAGTAPYAPTATTHGVEYTGAASANKVGGALFVAGLAAALL